MPVIDADTHVDENEGTWAYLDESEQVYRPLRIKDPTKPMGYWLIDGLQAIWEVRDDAATGTTEATRELIDVDARLRDMDRMGVDVQVIYPTTLMNPVTERAEVELAWRRSYNRWMAARTAKSNGRLRWVVLPPVQSMDRAIEELRFGKEHGACAVLKAGNEQAGFYPAESYFFPLYEEAQRLDLPIVFHVGTGTPIIHRAPLGTVSFRSAATILHAFASLADLGVPAQFPKLRWGFIEAFAGWVPYLVYWLGQQTSARGEPRPDNLLAANNFYVTCQEDEDLTSIMKTTGEDHLMIGSDYTHNDFSVQQNYVTALQERVERGELSESAARKMTCDNPTTFYGLR